MMIYKLARSMMMRSKCHEDGGAIGSESKAFFPASVHDTAHKLLPFWKRCLLWEEDNQCSHKAIRTIYFRGSRVRKFGWETKAPRRSRCHMNSLHSKLHLESAALVTSLSISFKGD